MDQFDGRPSSYPFSSIPSWTVPNRLSNSGIFSFQNKLPETEGIAGQRQTLGINTDGERHIGGKGCEKTEVPQISVNSSGSTLINISQTNDTCRELRRSVLWKMVLIIVPIALLSALLLGLVFGLQVETKPSLFPLSDTLLHGLQSSYILVNYSATRLTFVSSLLSLLAPFLGSFIMGLWSIFTAQSLQKATRRADVEKDDSKLPHTDDFRLVVGITLASTGELLRYFMHLSKRRLSVPPVLHKAAVMFGASLALACGIFVANTVFQYQSQAINFDAIMINDSPTHEFGRGLSTMCLDFNRTANSGYPCTYDIIAPESEWLAISEIGNEIYFLQQNISRQSEIRLVGGSGLGHSSLAILIPQVRAIPANIDYRGSTVGVSTQCQSISPKCHMKAVGPAGINTQFNCTDNFYGVLGKPPNVTTVTASLKAEDPDLPPMAFKPSQSLQYAFFTNAGLRTPYNTEGYNVATGNTEHNVPFLQDSELINPVYVAVAGRFSVDDESAGSPINDDPGFFHDKYRWLDFVLNCSYTTYSVDYTWSQGSIRNTSFSPSPNGTLAEMYHGAQVYSSVSGGAPVLSANLERVALQNTSDSFATEWANLYSVDILSQIGAYMTPRMSLLEQTRKSMLVTKVPKTPLGVLLAFSLTYVVLGLVLGIAAYRASSTEVWALATELSLSALVAAAFETGDVKKAGDRSASTGGDGVIGSDDGKGGRIWTVSKPGKGWGYGLRYA